jgi:ParB-like chromosome segregation protein Spo0J
METIDYPIKDLVFAEYNPRTITMDEMNKLKNNLQEFGCVQPVVANTGTTEEGKAKIVGGHQRVTAALELGWETIPTVLISEPDEKREKALNLSLNKIAGTWDFGRLSEILTDLGDSEGDFDIELTGFSVFETDELTKITEGLGDGGFGEGSDSRTPEAPDDFPSFDDDIPTDYECPKCKYSWSGRPK